MASIPNLNWGSIADWVSGIGSLAAATVALYVALSSQRVKLRGYCGHRLILGGPEPQFEVFSVSVTNISQRPTVITNVGFTFGIFRWKRHGLITFMQDDISHGIPKTLSDGETANWNVRLGPNQKWVKELIEKFEVSRFSVATWRVHVHTSNGGTTALRPEKNIREILVSAIKERKRG